ncbi:YidB family protein [Limobrevibacterium gyesilva]|uniref:YidB family protein n=1 Tax=Limobrevibacterium gyesilva TaxID=2991712 RepID=A0AA41YIA0_9PROT|nr:YidB family protein [Limobrevibacterium gyesilva]MCW3474044.1 YidB family protein [Limobrevibacterium gyesilva]
MSVLDTIVQQLVGPESASPWLAKTIRGLLTGGADGIGVKELIRRMEAAGLGDIARSWLGKGPNLPISPQQLRQVLGPEILRGTIDRSGLTEDEVLAELSEHLPAVINHLTPGGQLPD